MTEIEKIQRAKEYMDQLANGVDPISGMAFEEDTVLNNVRLSRCFFYVSDVLRQVLENGGVGKKPAPRQHALPPFSLPHERRSKALVTSEPIVISKFTERFNELADLTRMKKLSYVAFTSWLLDKGFLFEETVNGKKRRKPSRAGQDIGIEYELREGQYGEYLSILYTESAQRFLVEHFDEITAALHTQKSEREST